MNKAIIMGRLGRDPEIKHTNGGQVANLSIATSKVWFDKNKQKQEKTEWHRVVAWAGLAEKCVHLAKGALVLVEGEISTRMWEGKDGQKNYTTEIVAKVIEFAEDKKKPSKPATQGYGPEPSFDSNEEIPF